MVIAAIKAITWGTVAAAVASALLMAATNGGMAPRISSLAGDVMTGRQPPSAGADGSRATRVAVEDNAPRTALPQQRADESR